MSLVGEGDGVGATVARVGSGGVVGIRVGDGVGERVAVGSGVGVGLRVEVGTGSTVGEGRGRLGGRRRRRVRLSGAG